MFKKVLIANRGEIAIRVIRACRTMGILTVAVYSEADRNSLHVMLADEAYCIGPAASSESYLKAENLIEVAKKSGAEAIHPGYGFLAEDASFADLCERCHLTFIGPSPAAMRSWGDKVSARANALRYGLPLLPGSEVLRNGAHARAEAERVGYPIILDRKSVE